MRRRWPSCPRRATCASLAFWPWRRWPSRDPGTEATSGGRVRKRQHVNPLGLGLARRFASAPALPDGAPLEIEIGCADAQFLFERARRHPGHIYVGVDIRQPLIDAVN